MSHRRSRKTFVFFASCLILYLISRTFQISLGQVCFHYSSGLLLAGVCSCELRLDLTVVMVAILSLNLMFSEI